MIAFYFKLKSSYYFVNRVEEMQAEDQSSSWHKGKLRFCKEVGWESRLQTFWLQSPLSLHSEDPQQGLCLRVQSPGLWPHPSAPGPTHRLRPRPRSGSSSTTPDPAPPTQAPPRRPTAQASPLRFGPAPAGRHIGPSAQVASCWSSG